MHVPDGFLNAPVSVATGAVAAAAVAVSLRGARRELAGDAEGSGLGAERTAPLAGLVAAFVFAVQMLNFPVAAGTSGHLLGGALAAILVGPYTGVLCVSVVLLMQGLLFADGGLSALGTNILLMGVVTVVVAYALFRGLLRVLPAGRGSVGVATFVAALVSVPASAIAFTGLYAIGGTADVSIGKVFAAMAGVHVLIGIGEAAITTATVGAVLAVRPDLVHGAADAVRTTLVVRTPAGAPARPATPEPAPAGAPARGSLRPLWLGGLGVTVVCAAFVSFYASASPDGLEKVATDEGIIEEAREHDLADSPLADYGVRDLDNERLSIALAGSAGVAVTLAAGTATFLALRRRGSGASAPDGEPQRA
ncbi:energy-coupling factor ABC transporter permease [Streptomyces sp. B6B3]|uniref:energy-coupling factor ABC transporter permease n=1 Tax=Streptomyces sp. B6B3 TaxID=3153570 RepID=UPI00325E1FCC